MRDIHDTVADVQTPAIEYISFETKIRGVDQLLAGGLVWKDKTKIISGKKVVFYVAIRTKQ
jgi:hypothetical protein